MNRVVKYNIKLSIQTLKSFFSYFDMNEKNTIIKLATRNDKVMDTLSDYKDNIICDKDENGIKCIYLKNLSFSKLYYYLSKVTIFNIYYYKVEKKYSVDTINEDYEVMVHVSLDKIKEISFNDNKYDYEITKKELKKYRSINIELIIILIIGLIIRFGR